MALVPERQLLKDIKALLAAGLGAQAGTPINGTASTKAVTFTGQPATNDTFTTGGVIYRFVAALSQANDVKIGLADTDTIVNLGHAITYDGGAGTNEGATYGAGTAANSLVTAGVASLVITLTARAVGVAGDGITVAKTGTHLTWSAPSHLGGGVDPTPGVVGARMFDDDNLYMCTAPDFWKVVAAFSPL